MKKLLQSFAALFIVFSLAVPGLSSAADNSPFKDVGGTFWAKDEINNLAKLGIIGGYPDKTFKPGSPVTREEFAALIARAFYLDLPGSNATASFSDVSNSRWSFAAIEASKEFLTGYYTPSGKSFFDPTSNATREDVAVALVKALHYQPDELQDSDILDRFYDSDDVSPNIRTYMALAVEKKLITGYQNGMLKPGGSITRAESAAMLYRVIKGAAGDSQEQLVLNVSAPDTVSSPTFYISGDVTKGATVTINDKDVEVVQGQFRIGFRLEEEGTYTYTVSARLPGGKTQSVTKTIRYEKGAPVLTVTGVPESTDQRTIKVSWTVKDENDSNPIVTVNGERQSSYYNSATVELEEGDNTITVTATNSAGKSAEVVKHVVFQGGGPVLKVQDIPATVSKDSVTVSWIVTDKNDSYPKVYLNGELVYGTSSTVSLKEGANTITVKAVNSLGKSTVVTKTVVLSGGAPDLKVDPLPATTDKDSITVSWRVQDSNDSNPKVYVNDELQYGSSTSVRLVQGDNSIVVRAVNKLGKTSEVTQKVTFASSGPVLTVGAIPETTNKDSIQVSWTASDKNDSYPKVYLNGQQQYGSSTTVDLKTGTNTLQFKATNSLGQSTEVTRTIVFEPSAPNLTLGYVPETTNASSFTLTWKVSDDNDYSPKVYVNDELMYSSSTTVNLKDGANTFKIVASNSYGKTTTVNCTITYTPAG